MADLLVHFSTAYAAGKFSRDSRFRALLYLGVLWPDLLYKGLLYGFGASTWACEPTHTPFGLVAWCYLAALLFEEAWRKRAFLALFGGSILHLVADAAKNYMGSGVILWGFPFTMDRFELGWYYPEETLTLMPAALALILLLELLSTRKAPQTVLYREESNR